MLTPLPFRSSLLSLAIVLFASLAIADEKTDKTAKDDQGVETEIIQEAAADAGAVQYGQAIATRYKVGAKIKSRALAVQNILVMVTVPLECPEQEVHVVEEDFSPEIEGVEFRPLPDQKGVEPGARQMLITISQLPPRTEAHALITYEVVTKTILPPEQTATLKIPEKPERWLKTYLSSSPFINVGDRKIREAIKDAYAAPKKKDNADKPVASADGVDTGDASPGDEVETSPYEEIGAFEPKRPDPVEVDREEGDAESGGLIGVDEKASFDSNSATPAASPSDETSSASTGDWERVEAIYDYVVDHIKYEEGAQDKSSVQALKDGKADCHGISALFVAMCRTAKVPARMVWVDGHQYAEFYLEDEAGKGHWYPVQSAGSRSFGEMPTPKVILQKGDNFRVPERRRERLRYASDFAIFLSTEKNKPIITYVREQL